MFFPLICTFFTFGCLELGLYWVMNYISCGFPIPLKLIIVVKGLLEWTFRTGVLLDICRLSKVWGLRRFFVYFLFLVISQHLFLHQCFFIFCGLWLWVLSHFIGYDVFIFWYFFVVFSGFWGRADSLKIFLSAYFKVNSLVIF